MLVYPQPNYLVYSSGGSFYLPPSNPYPLSASAFFIPNFDQL
jgi:hypothetical protein